MMFEFLEIIMIGFFALLVVTGFFYECMCILLKLISYFNFTPRALIYTLITGIFIAHGLAILIYALIYLILVHWIGYDQLSGLVNNHFLSYVYYSATTYSSLGVGDVLPTGELRFITGLQSINGLILITWSATISFFSIQKMWKEHDIDYRI